MTRTVLIAGASGHFGRAAQAAFTAAGWDVRRYLRGSDMAAAAQGADVIVNALNPPKYNNWAQHIPAITAQVIAAARASAARVVVPGNVNVYGALGGVWGPDAPQNPHTRKGKIRAEMETSYRASGIRTLILRGGDFIDPTQTGTLFSMMTAKAGIGKLTRFGRADALHAYAPVQDMARAAVALCALPNLPDFADIPYAGQAFSVDDFAGELARQLGRAVKISAFPWWAMQAAAPFWELARELIEMRYLSDISHELNPANLAALLPDFRGQTLAQIVAQTLKAG